jgi:hypothetical protein
MTIPAARRVEIMQAVSAGLSRGTPLTIICEALQAQGSFAGRALYYWLRDDPEAKLAIEYGRDLGHDWIAREALEIADDTSNDTVIDSEGGERGNTAAVLRARLRVDTRLKLLAKWSPRYREGSTVHLEGEVQVTQRHVLDPRLLDDAGRAALRALLQHAQAQGLIEGPEPVDAEYEETALDDEA